MDFFRHPVTLRRRGRQGRPVIALVEDLERRSLLTLTPVTGTTLSLTAGVPPASPVVVGYFVDSVADAPGDFTASIAWGDGHTSAGSVAAVPGSTTVFSVSGSNTYAATGSDTVTTSVLDNVGDTASITSTATVLSPVSATGTTFTTTPGVPLPSSTVVANFTDSNPAAIANPSLVSAIITWGDGQTSTGAVNYVTTNNGVGTFTVTATHTYSAPGTQTSYSVGVKVVDPTGQTSSATSTAVVASPISANRTTFVVTPGVNLANQVVATFIDPNAGAAASKAVINWGDGQTTGGTIVPSGAGGAYTVTGSHTYPASFSVGSYAVTVTIVDPMGASATANSTAIAVVSSGFTGGLAPVVTNGPYAARGFTNTNRPVFGGTTAAFATVDVYARHYHTDALIALGEAVAGSNGQWTLVSATPLAAGKYTVTATVTVPGGFPTGSLPLHNADGTQVVAIGLTPKHFRTTGHGAQARPGHRTAPSRVRHHRP